MAKPINSRDPLTTSPDMFPVYGDGDYIHGDCAPNQENGVHRYTGDPDFDMSLEFFAQRNPDLRKRMSLYIVAPTSGEAVSTPVHGVAMQTPRHRPFDTDDM